MTTIKDFIKSHPLLSHYALVFAISWGGVLLVIGGPNAIPGTEEQFERAPVRDPGAARRPPIAGILLTGLLYGRGWLSRPARQDNEVACWSSLVRGSAPHRSALDDGGTPCALASLPSISPPAYLPLATGVHAAIRCRGGAHRWWLLEELGWTGFAIPRLLARHSVLATGLIGVLWGAWHVLTNAFWASGSSLGAGELSLAGFLIVRSFDLLVGQLLAYRVLMVWVYDRSGGSLLVGMLMHASLTASTLILGPLAISGAALLTYVLVSSAAMWAVVGVVVVANGGHLTRQPPPRRVS